jgi:tRNA(fMet)-specific endonuclease VapC
MYMLDTDTCIYIMKNKTPNIVTKFSHAQGIAISAIVLGELRYGVANSDYTRIGANQAVLNGLLGAVEVVPWCERAATHYGLVRHRLRGNLIGSNDMLIAAHALAMKATLVTNNTREFGRVSDLLTENWL